MLHVLVGMVAVDESHIDSRQTELLVAGEELLARGFVVRDDVLHAEPPKMLANELRIAPEVHAADGPRRPVAEKRVRGIDKRQLPAAIVLQAQRQANHAESIARPDYHHVFGPQGADQTIVNESESEVLFGGHLAMSQRLGVVEDLLDRVGIKAKR